MSREMYTSVAIEGTPDQLFAMLKTLQSFETDWQEQYWELAHSKQVGAELDHGYLERVETCGCFLKDMTDEALRSLAEKSPRGCTIRADGPMGSFYEPGEIGLFEKLAEAAPNAAFSGTIEGIAWGAEFRQTAELKNGHLELNDKVYGDDDEGYYEEGYCDEGYDEEEDDEGSSD